MNSWKNLNTEYIKPELRCWLGREFIGGKGKYIVFVAAAGDPDSLGFIHYSYLDNAGYAGWLCRCSFWLDETTKISYDEACRLIELGEF